MHVTIKNGEGDPPVQSHQTLDISDEELVSNKFPSLKKQRRREIKINLSITPMSVQKTSMKENVRFMEIQKEMEEMEEMKNYNTSEKKNRDINVKKCIRNMIKEYNQLIQYKKWKEVGGRNRSRNVEDLNEMLEVIRLKERQFQNEKNLLAKFNHNLQITRLYREYSNSMSMNHKFVFSPQRHSAQSVIEVMNKNKMKNSKEKRGSGLQLMELQNYQSIECPSGNENVLKRQIKIQSSHQIQDNLKKYQSPLSYANSPVQNWKIIDSERKNKSKKQVYSQEKMKKMAQPQIKYPNLIKSQQCLTEGKNVDFVRGSMRSEKHVKDNGEWRQRRKIKYHRISREISERQTIHERRGEKEKKVRKFYL